MTFEFQVSKVKVQQQRLGVVDAKALWDQKSKPNPEAWSPGSFLKTPLNPLTAAIGHAYNEHRPLALSPDMLWVAITQGFARHVEAHAEELRHHFVQHEGKKYIEIRRDGFVKSAPDNDWPGCFSEFSDRLAEHIGKKRDLIVSDFSTTTPVARAASEIVLMDAMQNYFRFGVRTLCGFPSVTLEGTVDDWEHLWLKAANLAEFNLKWWLDHLMPVLEKLVETARGNPDLKWWARAYQSHGGSGGPHISGWINAFFPYFSGEGTRDGKPARCPYVDWTKYSSGGWNPDSYPSGLSKVPFLWHYYGQTFTMNFLGGLIGIEQADDGTLRPAFGWAVADDPTAVKDHECELAPPFTSHFCTLCGRTMTGRQMKGQREKLEAKIRADWVAKHGEPQTDLEKYNLRDAIFATLWGKKDEPDAPPSSKPSGGLIYSVSEPEYVGAQPIRTELFSEPYQQPGAPKTKGWVFGEVVGEVQVDPNPDGSIVVQGDEE